MFLLDDSSIAHYGIPGQKKGVRRWQYEDGRFNEEGKMRYFGTKYKKNALSKLTQEEANSMRNEINNYILEQQYTKFMKEKKHPLRTKIKKNINNIMKNTIIDSIIVSAALYTANKYLNSAGIKLTDNEFLNKWLHIDKNKSIAPFFN